ncbi:hypothetical protein OG301_31310 [Streptomyces platensis]|uniref:hypothetical protein n=1 Tax=Streptomyces platensis TaxID=58346 RepID=UPI002ED64144|nr:hypothetical protein OG301_31310 [Streptomyces platensis]
MAFREQSQAAFQVLDLLGELPDSVGQQTQGDASGLQHRLSTAPVVPDVVGEPCAGTEEFRVAQPSQLFPQIRVGGNQDSLELVDRLGAGAPGLLKALAGTAGAPGALPPALGRTDDCLCAI